MMFLSLMVLAAGAPNSALDASFDPWTADARYELTYRVDASSLVHDGERTRLWIPLPRTDAYQRLIRYEVDARVGYVERMDDFGNRMIYLEIEPGDRRASDIKIRMWVARKVARVLGLGKVSSVRTDWSKYLAATRKIPLGGVVATLAARIAAGIPDPSKRIRSFYDYVVTHMRYSKKGTGWGHGDAVRACDVKYGNCTDFHSLLIGLLRSQGIPARFSIGFPIPSDVTAGSIEGYHCWAELFDKSKGWIPVDASEAFKSGRRSAYFGTLPSDRVAFTVGRDLTLNPAQEGEPLNFFVYPYAERGGSPLADVPWTLRFSRLTGDLSVP